MKRIFLEYCLATIIMYHEHFSSKIFAQTLKSNMYSTMQGFSQDLITENFKASYSTLRVTFLLALSPGLYLA